MINAELKAKLKDHTFLLNVVLCPAVFFFIALAIISARPEGPLLFRYDQYDVTQGELWRIISAHFTHRTWEHFGLNMLGLGILSVLFAQVATWSRWLIIFLFSSLFCSVGFYLFGGPNYAYVGMSAVLHGVIIAYAFLDFKHFKIGNLILIVGALAKVLWEQSPWYVEASSDFIGGRIAIESHLYGAISGLILGIAFVLWDKTFNKVASSQTKA